MNFWDSSAVIPLLVAEAETKAREHQFSRCEAVTVWWGTRVECVSALRRRLRDRALDQIGYERAARRLDVLSAGWQEVAPHEKIRARAERLLTAHALRAADALQLSAALVACSERTVGSRFYTADRRLAEAAAREGFALE